MPRSFGIAHVKPIRHKRGNWCVQFSAKNSGTGKRKMRYYKTKKAAEEDIDKHLDEVEQFGASGVTTEERNVVNLCRQQLGGDLSLLPQVLEHWRKTGAGAVHPTRVEEAVMEFQKWRLPRVNAERLPTFGLGSRTSRKPSKAGSCTKSTQASSRAGCTV